MWLQVGCTKAAVGQWRPLWLKSVSGAHFVSVCVLFYMEAIAIVTENGLRSIINDNFLYFNYVALLHSTLANVSMSPSRGWGTMAAVVQQRLPWFILFLRSTSMVDVFCVTNVLIHTSRRAVNLN